jgi:hypothetical protein
MPETDSVREDTTTPTNAMAHLGDKKNPPVVHVVYNGLNHYDLYQNPANMPMSVPIELRRQLRAD